MSEFHLNRRAFLTGTAVVAGGLVLGIPAQRAVAMPNARAGSFQTNAWLQITPADEVIFQLDKTEMGQGVLTALPTILAEELEIDPRRILVELAPVNKAFQDPIQMTGGSASVSQRWDILRTTGAQAREMLVAAAAARWAVRPDQCRADNGRVLRVGTDESFSYGELANDAAKLRVPKKPALKDPADFKYIGKSLRRFDGTEKSNGAAIYGMDVDVPDAAVAILIRNPHFGGSLQSFDAAAARNAPGVIDVFDVNGAIAVVADTYWHATKAARAVSVTWDKGPLGALDSAAIRAAWVEMAKEGGHSIRDDGDTKSALTKAASVLDAVYEVPYLAHATMEPQNTTASYRDGACEIWSPNQGPDVAQALAADALGIPRDKVTVHTTLMGGGFGRRGIPDFVPEAALVSRQVKRPVKLIWSREDDMRHDFYRPATYNVMKAALNDQGQVQSWSHKIVAPSMFRSLLPVLGKVAPEWMPHWLTNSLSAVAGSLVKTRDPTAHEGAVDHPYAIPNVDVAHVYYDPGVPLGFWRSVGHSQNAFVVEGFVDELAHEAGEDPYKFRRRLLQNSPRHLAVLDLVAEKANWGNPTPGTHQGIAVHESFGSVVAEVVEVRVVDNDIKVQRVVCAADCGLVVNPDQVHAQVESAVIFGLTAALRGKITIKDGAVEQSNFHDYPLLRMNEVPIVEVHIVPSTNSPTGIGEPGTPPIAPAVANAVFVATGTRLRSLPLTLGA
ncbi:MAG TPA: xanthine dehydrogenase family protein molybdopterin-binding subunit [Pseudomonadales bacterium]|nr:xanthine dehydrogenase family protein molybdopterin-binding subunit [Pseudomonadales bacterium]